VPCLRRRSTTPPGTCSAPRELIRTGGDPRRGSATADAVPEPTLQMSRSPAGVITCAAPPLTFDGAPTTYPIPAHAWGTDEPRWTGQPEGQAAATKHEERRHP
jgi:hypothetical protein